MIRGPELHAAICTQGELKVLVIRVPLRVFHEERSELHGPGWLDDLRFSVDCGGLCIPC